ncbi:transcriptional regulator [Xylophilus sp.]|uniref:transcriptional regulator n=1 Tax=Xylophilus sp. TaxID=2653893 RepID=UPI002D7FF48C|nr:transcriptional regulator [Xylophilus sp.]
MSGTPASRPHEEAVIEELRLDPEYAAGYVAAVLADGDAEELRLCLRRVAVAFMPCDFRSFDMT